MLSAACPRRRAGARRNQQGSGPQPGTITARRVEPDDVAAVERHRQAVQLVGEIEHLDNLMGDSRERITTAVAASRTTLRRSSGSARSSPACSSATAATRPVSPPPPLRRLHRHRSDRILLRWPREVYRGAVGSIHSDRPSECRCSSRRVDPSQHNVAAPCRRHARSPLPSAVPTFATWAGARHRSPGSHRADPTTNAAPTPPRQFR